MATKDKKATDTATEVVRERKPGTVSVRQFRLRVEAGPEAGTSWKSSGARAIVGKDQTCDLILTDRSVSQFHCEIAWVDDRVRIRDLGSSNDTIVDGVAVREGYLAGGENLLLGRTELRFDVGSAAVEVPVTEAASFGGLVGSSVPMRAVFARLERAAQSDVTVLLEGETGTGKEIAAEAVHQLSARKAAPFIVVDCGAIAPALLESELFGHEKGAFTGADQMRIGAFEAADGGTVFLDEVGELALELQPKLLRVLERREVQKVGSAKRRPVDVRVIAATHRNLRTEVNRGNFRADLYYRLAVLDVHLPALRERLEDLPLLVEKLLAGLGTGKDGDGLRSPQFVKELTRHSWPGNVRELRNHLDRCLATHSRPPIARETGAKTEASVDIGVPLARARDLFDLRYLTELIGAHEGNVADAARAAGMNRQSFYRLLARHGIR